MSSVCVVKRWRGAAGSGSTKMYSGQGDGGGLLSLMRVKLWQEFKLLKYQVVLYQAEYPKKYKKSMEEELIKLNLRKVQAHVRDQ